MFKTFFQSLIRPGQRRGTVMIFVVALLVLLALIGTAFVSSARIDRYGSVQTTINSQIDLLVEGVGNMAGGFIVGSLFDANTGLYRPALDSTSESTNTYANWTYA